MAKNMQYGREVARQGTHASKFMFTSQLPLSILIDVELTNTFRSLSTSKSRSRSYLRSIQAYLESIVRSHPNSAASRAVRRRRDHGKLTILRASRIITSRN